VSRRLEHGAARALGALGVFVLTPYAPALLTRVTSNETLASYAGGLARLPLLLPCGAAVLGAVSLYLLGTCHAEWKTQPPLGRAALGVVLGVLGVAGAGTLQPGAAALTCGGVTTLSALGLLGWLLKIRSAAEF
tara:strand:- start:1578 stop:1979 length:402 start_codon:yes stop_codon:yes gene_type:complete